MMLSVIPNSPVCEDGTVLVLFQVEGSFYQDLDFRSYPLDKQVISAKFEDLVYTTAELVYVLDEDKSGFSESISFPGWSLRNSRTDIVTVHYGTTMGYGGTVSDFSRFIMGLDINRGNSIFVFKALPPIIITVVLCGCILLLDFSSMDTRITTASGCFLALVFLQLTMASAQLPSSLDYLTMLDWLFMISYILSMLVCLECIVIKRYLGNIEAILESFGKSSSRKGVAELKDLEVVEQADSDSSMEREAKTKHLIRKFEKIGALVYLSVVFIFFIIVPSAFSARNSHSLH
eukprot:TRINITY_DN4968_c0_g1_i1.p1 TRINITY_DN4968_c0_g1~~TRINITY_DN4968_c0_g1_i1.p1  ORF type:complete len:290 (+),score=29.10 TRINITY_DN4968_c0_g1_i1:602-1471(+)